MSSVRHRRGARVLADAPAVGCGRFSRPVTKPQSGAACSAQTPAARARVANVDAARGGAAPLWSTSARGTLMPELELVCQAPHCPARCSPHLHAHPPAQIYVAVALGDDASHLNGDFGAVSKAFPGGAIATTVEEFKECIIAAWKWTNVEDTDITILGPWETAMETRACFALPSAMIASAPAAVATIELAGPTAYVVARVASGVTPLRGASGLLRVLPPRVRPVSRACSVARRTRYGAQCQCGGRVPSATLDAIRIQSSIAPASPPLSPSPSSTIPRSGGSWCVLSTAALRARSRGSRCVPSATLYRVGTAPGHCVPRAFGRREALRACMCAGAAGRRPALPPRGVACGGMRAC